MLWLYLSILSIRVNPRLLLANQAVRVTCLVQHRAENRRLIMQIEGYRSSEWELEGEAAPGMFEVLYEHVPCGTEAASCTLIESTGKATRAALPIEVHGCQDTP